MTTATAGHVEHQLREVVGRTEEPPGSNHVFIWTDLIEWGLAEASFQGQPWCAAGQRWAQHKAGAPLPDIADPYYCPSIVTFARVHGLWDTSGHYPKGALTLWCWSGTGLAEHVESVTKDGTTEVTELGCNTTPQNGDGDQANGGGIYLRTRPHGPELLGAFRYDKLLAAGASPARRGNANPFAAPQRTLSLTTPAVHGDDVRFVQWAAGCPVDGVFGPVTKHAVTEFQRHHHACGPADGVAGPRTDRVLATITH